MDIAYFTTFNNFSEALNFECLLLLRIGASILFAFLLGLEREVTGKFAGLRTHILVSAGACVFTLLSIFAFKMQIMDGFAGVNDPARIAAQIITGIGFIGAGTVMRHGNNIYGITTAATLLDVCCNRDGVRYRHVFNGSYGYDFFFNSTCFSQKI